MPPFFVLLLDPANTGGLARRCCTSILSLHKFDKFDKFALGNRRRALDNGVADS